MYVRDTLMLDLLVNLIRERAFDILRTKEQLGYLIQTSKFKWIHGQGLEVVIQGSHDPKYRILKGLAIGVTASTACGVTYEAYRTVRGAARSCSKCTAPVGGDGVFRGERGTRTLTFQWSVHPSSDSSECQKSLDATSVIVDWTWHRKCLRCNRCDQPLKGHRYRMLNNQILRYQVETKQPHNRRIPR
ncbi:hypothetical protein QR680_008236 [Steinernema hermaphroditum]|uniref:LIM zinc-binding domain-containing protein n=1 Tax=Steinernema hermaphroditum TaxID=289476 RepID=A0AA39IHA9_9BILA|nr:hypothetical protein QR680_008236 [Steinernema hermaphroditum]